MEIIMHKMDKEGKMTDEVVPGFTSNMKLPYTCGILMNYTMNVLRRL